jgi:hypothetical protein
MCGGRTYLRTRAAGFGRKPKPIVVGEQGFELIEYDGDGQIQITGPLTGATYIFSPGTCRYVDVRDIPAVRREFDSHDTGQGNQSEASES